MYQVLARKCRPQTFEELVGQEHVARTLANAIDSGRLAHAHIFAGLRGTGKTSVARILAKCLNCEKGPTSKPCGECDPCKEIAESRAIDVLELDAATRTQIDNIRELQEIIAYAPARDRNKVLIIDEAHMLSKNAANALLKTLEEPPPNVIFILATTEIQKLLPTILSRCQVFEFRRVGYQELTTYLGKICKAEKIAIDDTALERIARAGEGSVRDSLSVLERAVAFSGDEINDEDVLRMLGGVRFEVVVDLVHGLATRDAGKMLGVLDTLVDEGHDLLHFWGELITATRDLLLLQAVPRRQDMLARPSEEADRLREAAQGLTREDLTRTFQILADLEPVLKTSSQPRFMFESTLIRLGGLGSVRPIEEVLDSLRSGAPQKKNEPDATREVTRPVPSAVEGSFSSKLIASVFDARPMVGSILQEAVKIEVIGDALVIHLAKGMEALGRQLNRTENLEVLVKHAAGLLGRTVRVMIDSAADAATPPVVAESTPRATQHQAAASEPKKAPRREPAAKRKVKDEGLLDKAKNEPGIKKLLREFGAQVVDIRPLDPPNPEIAEEDK